MIEQYNRVSEKSKLVYLTLMFPILLSGWSIGALSFLGGNMGYIIKMLYLLWGYVFLNERTPVSGRTYVPYFITICGIALSMIPANEVHEQSYIQSLITYREFYLWFVLPVLFRMRPSEQTVVKSLTNCIWMMWAVYFMRILTPSLLNLENQYMEDWGEDGVFFGYVYGFSLSTIPLFYYGQRLLDDFTKKDLRWVVFLLLFIYVMHSRALMFGVILLMAISVMFGKARRKRDLILLACIIVPIVGYLTFDAWSSLILATTEQLSDNDYNRNKAYLYFLYGSDNTLLTNLLGQGYISTNTSSFEADLGKDGIFTADLGFIGFWFFFGIIPVIGCLLLLFRTIFTRAMPLYVKQLSMLVIVVGMTFSYFGVFGHAIWFLFIYYLSYYYVEEGMHEHSIKFWKN